MAQGSATDKQDTCVVIIDSLLPAYRDYLLPLDTSIKGVSLDSAIRYSNGIRSGLYHFSRELIQNAPDRKRAGLEAWKALMRAQHLSGLWFFKLLKDMPQSERDKSIWIVGALRYHDAYITLDEVNALFESFSPEVRESDLGKRTHEEIRMWEDIRQLEEKQNLNIGDFKDEVLLTEQDTLSTLATFVESDKPYKIILFGASWCSPCRHGEHLFKTWYDLLDSARNRLEIISISIDKDKSAWKRSVDDDALPWKSYLLEDVPGSKFTEHGVLRNGVPRILLIDSNNRVVAYQRDIREIIQRLPFVCYETL